MAERDNQNIDDLTYKQLAERFPEGSDDPEIVALLRKKRSEVVKTELKGHYVGFDGRVYSEEAYLAMSPAQKRGVCVGSTCIHYEGDVPKMSDTD